MCCQLGQLGDLRVVDECSKGSKEGADGRVEEVGLHVGHVAARHPCAAVIAHLPHNQRRLKWGRLRVTSILGCRHCLPVGLEWLLFGERHWNFLCGKLVPHPGFPVRCREIERPISSRSQAQAQPVTLPEPEVHPGPGTAPFDPLSCLADGCLPIDFPRPRPRGSVDCLKMGLWLEGLAFGSGGGGSPIVEAIVLWPPCWLARNCVRVFVGNRWLHHFRI